MSTRYALLVLFGLAACAPGPQPEATEAIRIPRDVGDLIAFDPYQRVCPETPAARTVEIREANKNTDKAHHDQMLLTFMDAVKQANATVLLGPNVELDFSEVEQVVSAATGVKVTAKDVFPIQI